MGGKLPAKTKEKVLKLWLLGFPRKKIAEKVGIGEGTVTSIVQDAKENIPDVDLLHKVATIIVRNNWDTNIFSSGIRHRKMLNERDLTDDQIDSLIENVDEHCFKRGISVQQFANLVQEVAETLLRFDCSINKLPELIAQKRGELVALQQEIVSLESYRLELLRENELIKKDIHEYSRDKPFLDTIKALSEEIRNLKGEACLDQAKISNLEDKLMVRVVPENMTREEVIDAAQLLIYNPVELVEVIRYIQKQAPLLPYTTTGLRIVDQDS